MEPVWGVTALSHDAAISVMRGNEILFAGHAERYSRIKNDFYLNEGLIADAIASCDGLLPSKIVWYERPFLKKTRQLFAGQFHELRSQSPSDHLGTFFSKYDLPIEYVSHHESHAAGGYFTSGFDSAAIIVVDAIGEWDTITIWEAEGNKLTKVFSVKYPNSLGLLYSAVTQMVGLKPNEEEYILMGMAAFGKPFYYDQIKANLVEVVKAPRFKLKHSVHKGISGWDDSHESDNADMAASVQKITEEYMKAAVRWCRRNIKSQNLVLSGGVALNCVANEKIAATKLFKNIWIMPNPGDAGSSLGAILAKRKRQANWQGPFLGFNIDRPISAEQCVKALVEGLVIGVANGRAEFGPRALGNRSLLADPRRPEMKDKVNEIKKRQKFRPFAPVILEEHAKDYFEMKVKSSPYMQFTAKCKFPNDYPAICHVDGTSRVQTLRKKDNPVLHEILDRFYEATGCPMLLNTSLNVKGEPLVNTWEDACRFSGLYNVPVF